MLVTSPFRPRSSGFTQPIPQLAFTPINRVRTDTSPAVRGNWTEDGYQFVVDLPGVPESAISVAVSGQLLTLGVATESTSWSHEVRLPQSLDAERVSARYLNGRLTVSVAKAASPQARSIAIDTTPAPEPTPAVDAASHDDAAEPAEGETGEQPAG